MIDPDLAGRLHFRHRLPTEEPLPPGRHDLGLFAERDAVLVVPEGLDPRRPCPLVVLFHGGGGSAEGDADGAPQVLSIQSLSEQTSPVVRLLDATLFDALKAEASDLHMECHPGGMTLRYRLDGVMEAVGEVGSREMAEQLVSRLKVMAELDIGERRLPQDGRFKLHVQAGESVRDVDFRVSIMPSSYGEDAVIRVLDRTRLAADHTALTLERLGFGADDSEAIHRLANKPYGMLVRKLDFPTTAGVTELQQLASDNQQVVATKPVSPPVMVYKVYADGREELVRNLRFRGLNTHALQGILGASSEQVRFDFVNNGALFDFPAAGGYLALTSVVSPGILLDEVEFERQPEIANSMPIVPAPALD